jgi:molecular chaperone GrpE
MNKSTKSQELHDSQVPDENAASDIDVETLIQQVNDLTEALQRERADSMNLRRRHDVQIAGLKDHLKADVIKQLLPVIDNFERSLKHIPQDLAENDYILGIKGIVKQFESSLESLGVEKIKTVGELFDPKYHEAVSMDDGKGSHEIVSEELQSGYKVSDNVIRHAMVKVKMGEHKSL